MQGHRKTAKPREVDTNWFLERMIQRGVNIKTLARLFTMDESSLGRIVRGKRRADPEAVLQLAREFETTTDEILARLGYADDLPPPVTCPIVGHVVDDASIMRDVPPEHVTTPAPSLVAIRCKTVSSPLNQYHNSVLYYYITPAPKPDAWLRAAGRLAVLELANPGRAVVGTYRADAGRPRIELLAGVGEIERPEVINAAIIEWIKLDG